MFDLVEKLLFLLPPELAHDTAVKALQFFGRIPGTCRPNAGTRQTLFGLEFQNRLGLAAGFDKDGQAIEGLARLGFGFVEVGTVTPLPQPGNPKPRLFRYPSHDAIINRMGFNNEGVESLARKLELVRSNGKLAGTIIGANVGKNKDTVLHDAYRDYVIGINRLSGLSDYITLNISSPNTPGLRSLQSSDYLEPMLDAVKSEQANQPRYTPLLLKVAPDLKMEDIELISERIIDYQIDGLIATNTTLDRPRGLVANEEGGLSGSPLYQKSRNVVSHFRRFLPNSFPIVGVGGVDSEIRAYDMLAAGADLLQIYTSFIYKSTKIVRKLYKL